MLDVPMSDSAEAVILKRSVAHHLRIQTAVVGVIDLLRHQPIECRAHGMRGLSNWILSVTGAGCAMQTPGSRVHCRERNLRNRSCDFGVSSLTNPEAMPIINSPHFCCGGWKTLTPVSLNLCPVRSKLQKTLNKGRQPEIGSDSDRGASATFEKRVRIARRRRDISDRKIMSGDYLLNRSVIGRAVQATSRYPACHRSGKRGDSPRHIESPILLKGWTLGIDICCDLDGD